MRSDVARHLAECRRKGLFVDDAFEADDGSVARVARRIGLIALIVALVAALVATTHPALLDAIAHRAFAAPRHFQPDLTRTRPPSGRTLG